MDPLQFLVPLDWLAVVGPALPFAILVLALANVATRHRAHATHVEQAADADSVDRYFPHVFTTVGLVLMSFLFTLVQPTGGAIISIVAATVLLADVFEFEARNVEARNELEIERPKSSIAASSIVVIYAVYYSLVALDATFWSGLFA
jgi:membrane protein required for beta-lactamase induction